MNNKQRRKIENLTRILSKQDSSTTFKVMVLASDQLVLWADNQESKWYESMKIFQAVIGVRGGVKVLSKRNFYI